MIAFMTEIKDEYGATLTNVRDKVDIKLAGRPPRNRTASAH